MPLHPAAHSSPLHRAAHRSPLQVAAAGSARLVIVVSVASTQAAVAQDAPLAIVMPLDGLFQTGNLTLCGHGQSGRERMQAAEGSGVSH